jgi:hypothetical protein
MSNFKVNSQVKPECTVKKVGEDLYGIAGRYRDSEIISVSGVGGTGGGGVGSTTSGTVTTLSTTKSFSASDSENIDLSLPGDFIEIIYGELYFDQPLAGEFNDLIRLELYSSGSRLDNQLKYIAEIPLRYTTLTSGANPSDTLISVNDGDGFVKDDLLYIMSPNSELRRVSSVSMDDLSLMSPIVSTHALGNGISKVGEIGGFSFYDISSNSKLYITLKFTTNQTCSVKLDLLVRG